MDDFHNRFWPKFEIEEEKWKFWRVFNFFLRIGPKKWENRPKHCGSSSKISDGFLTNLLKNIVIDFGISTPIICYTWCRKPRKVNYQKNLC